MRIVLADDHHLVRQSFRMLLESEADIPVGGEAVTGLDAIRLVENLRPDGLVVDLMMPERTGMEVARLISQQFPKPVLVILSMYENQAYALEALRAGIEEIHSPGPGLCHPAGDRRLSVPESILEQAYY